AIFARKRKVAVFRRAGTDRGVNLLAKAFPGFATCDHDLPRLAVAPGRGALRRRQYPFNGGTRYRLGLERAAGIAFAQQFFENLDRREIGVVVHYIIASVGTVSRTRCSVLHAAPQSRDPRFQYIWPRISSASLTRCAASGARYRPLVGILLNGTSLSTRMSPGSPSTRSAMMLRRISSVPPAMRTEGDDISMAWNWPAASVTSGSVSMPLEPCRSIAYIAMSCSIEPATSLPIEF